VITDFKGTALEGGPTSSIRQIEAPRIVVPEFKIHLNSFRILTREMRGWPGKKLRFTITWRVDIPPVNPELGDRAEELGMDIEGCLARVTTNGELVWCTPQARNGHYYANIVWASPDLYKRVQRAIAGSKYVKLIYTPHPSPSIDPKTLDPDIPAEIEA